MITRIEEISMNSWPALQTVLFDGWVLRFADGVTKRSNSINPIYQSTLQVEEKIGACEKLYSARNLKTVFKLTEKIYPADLDGMLENRGYEKNSVTSVQTLKLASFTCEPCNSKSVSEEFDGDWMNGFFNFAGIDAKSRLAYQKILQHIFMKRCFLTVFLRNSPVCCGLGVLADNYLGVFDRAVSPEYCGWGFGRLAMEGILDWGKKNGAETAFLQVFLDNTTAMKLYEKMGFEEIYKYWYRIKDSRRRITDSRAFRL
jgi:GNAT superfamily N-acetyltransferase